MESKEFGEHGEIILDSEEVARKLAKMLDISIEEARELNAECEAVNALANEMVRQFRRSA